MRPRSLVEGAALGPTVTLVTIVLIGLAARIGLRIPDAPVITLAAVIFAAFQGGFAPGLMSAAMALAFVFASFGPGDLPRVVVWSMAIPGTAILAGLMRRRLLDRSAHLEAANAELRSLAETDPLTGLKNRRSLMEGLGHEIARGARTRRPLSVIMLDVDHLKPFNDTFGHAAGDVVLKEVSAVLSQNLRITDLAARFGGDEFAIVLPDTDNARALLVAERIRRAIEGASGPQRPRDITVSLGAATLDPAVESSRTPVDAPTLLARADRALYEAKRSGRSRVIGPGFPLPAEDRNQPSVPVVPVRLRSDPPGSSQVADQVC